MQRKTSGNEPEGIVNKDLGYVSQIFLPKTMANYIVPSGFVYVIAPFERNHFYYLRANSKIAHENGKYYT